MGLDVKLITKLFPISILLGTPELKCSRPGPGNSVSAQPLPASSQWLIFLQCVLVGCRRQHARDKGKLQDLITELDQYVKDMDAGSKGHRASKVTFLALCLHELVRAFLARAKQLIVLLLVGPVMCSVVGH